MLSLIAFNTMSRATEITPQIVFIEESDAVNISARKLFMD